MSLTYLGCFNRMAPSNDKESCLSLTSLTGSTLLLIPFIVACCLNKIRCVSILHTVS